MMPFRIIVADKNPRVAAEMIKILADRDIQCLHVDSAAELKQAIKRQKPWLIVLAPLLKDTPHWRATQKIIAAIKQSQEYAETPVVILKGYPDGPPESQLDTLGADAYLGVPLEPKETLDLVESFRQSGAIEVPQIDDDDIVIDFDDDEEENDGYVEDKPMDVTSHSEAILEREATLSSEQSQSAASLELTGDMELTYQTQELTDLPFQTADAMADIESPDSSEQAVLEYTEIPTRSSEKSFDVVHESLNGIGDAGESIGLSEDLLRDFSHEHDELTETEPSVPSHEQNESQILSENKIEAKDVLSSSLQGLLPEKDAILAHLERSIAQLLPRRQELLDLVSQHICASLPSPDEFLRAVTQRVPVHIGGASGDQTTHATLSAQPPREPVDSVSEEWFLTPAKHSEGGGKTGRHEELSLPASSLTVDGLVKNIVREKIDEIMPDRDEILAWIRNEVDSCILETVEKIIRQKVEEITEDAS